MASNDKIRVPGYAQKVFYNDGIEYRNFSPDLVGIQLTNDSNTPLFTYGNFAVLKNSEGRDIINYPTKPYSKALSLSDINGSNQTTTLVFNKDIKINLNVDNSKLYNFAYFGSSTEFIRVTLESIITKWPASLYVRPLDYETYVPVYTVENYTYNNQTNTSSFKVYTNSIVNQYDITYTTSGSLLSAYGNTLRNLTTNYANYVVSLNNLDYKLLNFTPANDIYDDYIELTVEGNPFPSAITGQSLYETYHIKPNNIEIEKFFTSLGDFENYLLNRLTTPKYTSKFDYKIITDDGTIYDTSTSITWPTTDGYNLDFDTNEYVSYVSQLLEISTSLDETISDLMTRFLVSESISNFDTIPRCDGSEEETAGQKMNKTLKVYGREFDEIKKYIDGLAYSNHVSYDKKNNAPDEIIKYIARVMGWQLTSSVLENDLLKTYLDVPQSSYSGQSRGLTANEAEIELWRRLILNSAWLFKSKGTRKAIEFLFKFIGAPEGLINLNEYVYVAKEKINMDTFNLALEEFGLSNNIEFYNVDSDGYPNKFPNNPNMYFQKGGLWYRETGGANSSNIVLDGNNPHIGPYDGGTEYINQFRNIIPGFEPIVITSSTFTTNVVELFTNYNNGLINNYTGDTYVDIETYSGVTIEDCFLYEAQIITDPHPEAEQTECGCDLPTEDLSLYIDIIRGQYVNKCETKFSGYTFVNNTDVNYFNKPLIYNWNYLTYNIDGTINGYYTSPFVSPTCCKSITNGNSFLHDEYNVNPETGESTLVNSGYICCKPFRITGPIKPTSSEFGFSMIKENTNPTIDSRSRLFLNKNSTGCGCYIGCQWRLAGPLLGNMYSVNNDIYLKFVTPENNWGTTGPASYRLGSESDGCMCPPNITTVEVINDPYINKPVYACKLNEKGYTFLKLNEGVPSHGTVNSELYQLFYQKSIGKIGCTSFRIQSLCNINITPLPRPEINKEGALLLTLPAIYNGTPPYQYNWQIVTQSGSFSNYAFYNGSNNQTATVGPIGSILSGGGNISFKLTITDANGCVVSGTTSYAKLG